MKKTVLGKRGEDAASVFLQENGYTILQRNWRYQKYEIDIIAKTENIIVFLEVKTRTTNYFGEPYSFVNRNKQSHLIHAAQKYAELNCIDEEIRFDIISVIFVNQQFEIEHITDAFGALTTLQENE